MRLSNDVEKYGSKLLIVSYSVVIKSEWLWAYLLNVAISTWMVQSLTRMPVYHTVQTRPHSPTTFLVYYNM